jgi:hypothetical protein
MEFSMYPINASVNFAEIHYEKNPLILILLCLYSSVLNNLQRIPLEILGITLRSTSFQIFHSSL